MCRDARLDRVAPQLPNALPPRAAATRPVAVRVSATPTPTRVAKQQRPVRRQIEAIAARVGLVSASRGLDPGILASRTDPTTIRVVVALTSAGVTLSDVCGAELPPEHDVVAHEPVRLALPHSPSAACRTLEPASV